MCKKCIELSTPDVSVIFRAGDFNMKYCISILTVIKSNIAFYIFFCGAITGIIVFTQNLILNKINNSEKTTRKLITTFIICVLVSSATLALSHLFPYTPKEELPEELIYDIYDDQEVIKRIALINKDLKDEGKQINETDLKAFIYAMNGEYSLIDRDTLLKISTTISNIDNGAINILRDAEIDVIDTHTSTTSFSEVFSNKTDSTFVNYWCNRYDLLMENVYRNGLTNYVVKELDDYNMDLYSTFINHEPVTIRDSLKISDYSISEEAKYFLAICVNRNVPFMTANLEGGNRTTCFKIQEIDGQAVYINSDQLYEELQTYNEDVLKRILHKIPERTESRID